MGDVLRAHRGHRRASWLISGVFAAFGALTCMASPSAAFDGSGGAIDLAHSSETVAHSNPDALAAQHVDVRGVADELEAEAIVAQLAATVRALSHIVPTFAVNSPSMQTYLYWQKLNVKQSAWLLRSPEVLLQR